MSVDSALASYSISSIHETCGDCMGGGGGGGR